MKVQVIKPKQDDVVGAWVSDRGTDVHVTYEDGGFVLGRNPANQEHNFTNPAVILTEGKIMLQKAGPDGNVTQVPLAPRILKEEMEAFLQRLVDRT